MSFPYQSPAVALADLLMTAWSRLKHRPLVYPHTCNECGRTAHTVPLSRPVTATGAACRRVRWSLRICTGRLTKAATS